MKERLLVDVPRFKLWSYGNGWAYRLKNQRAEKDLFVQDEVAQSFHRDWQALEQAYPEVHTSFILSKLWEAYNG